MNILILSSGRKVTLVQGFKNALKKLNIEGKIIAADMNENAPAQLYADKACKIKPIRDEGYVDDIIRICNEEDIKMIIPIMDIEIDILSRNKEKIESKCNAKAVVSNKDTVSICRNKFKTAEFLQANGFYTPKVITEEDLVNKNYQFPVFIKPFDGAGSVDAHKINNEEELAFYKKNIENPIIQEYIEGQEYGIDMFMDFDGNPITIIPQREISRRGGDFTRCKIEKHRDIMDTMKRLAQCLYMIGDVCLNVIMKDDKVYIIEINARLDSLAPINFEIGGDSASNLIRLLLGEKLEYTEDFKDNITFMFYDDFMYI